jgi:hypothetical protein
MSIYATPLCMGDFTTDLDHAFDNVDTIVQETSYIGAHVFPSEAAIHSANYVYCILQKAARPFETLSKAWSRWGVPVYDADSDTMFEAFPSPHGLTDTLKIDILGQLIEQDEEQLPQVMPQLLSTCSSMSYESPGVTRQLPVEKNSTEFDFSMPPLVEDVSTSTTDVSYHDCRSVIPEKAASWLPKIPSLSDVNIFDIRWY